MAYDGIYYGSKWYGRSEIKSASTIRAKSMVSEECSVNTLTAEIYSEDIGENPLLTVYSQIYAPNGHDAYVVTGTDIRQFVAFAPVELWNDGTLLGKYYLTGIERTARNWFRLSACSPIGILEQIEHKGGLYSQATFSAICADIIGSAVTYTVDAALANLPINGWLPYSDARSNLQQLLFAVGAAATYDASGNMSFKYIEPDVSVDIPDNHLYQGGAIGYPSKASKVTLIEHAWFQDNTVDTDVLYDNTGGASANNDLIVFKEPYHTLVGTGLTVTQVNCNCCYVTGTGTLTGKKYAHTRRELVQQDTTISAEEKRVENATLISSLNSLNALRRVYNYLRNANEVSYGIVSDGSFKCGDLISFTDPFGEATTGYVKEMSETVSGIIKSDTKIATNWVPKYLGNTYEHSMIIKASDLVDGVWNVPGAMQGHPALVVLFGGFGGGQGGYNGTDGETKWYSYPNFRGYTTYLPAPGIGGAPGIAGSYPKYIIAEYESLASTYTVSFGQGGSGGAANGGAGNAGGHSVFGTYDTDNGDALSGEYVNLLDGSIVASKGDSGFRGGNGGTTTTYNNRGTTIETLVRGRYTYERYDSMGADGNAVGVYSGGLGCHGGSVVRERDGQDEQFYDGPGAGGGGAAYGANGGNANEYWNASTVAPKAGGNGANAVAPSNAVLGKTGTGGNGGGGGGASGIAFGYVSGDYNDAGNHPGDGGSGSTGGKGSDGFALIYY